MPRSAEDNSRINRLTALLLSVDSGWMANIYIFCTGLLSGFGGGFLLGAISVVVLQSLDLLADNSWLLDHLEKYDRNEYSLEWEAKESVHWENENLIILLHKAFLAVMFGVISLTLTVVVVNSIRSLKKHGQAENALEVAGPACLIVVIATGYLLGIAFEIFLFLVIANVVILLFLLISVIVFLFLTTPFYCNRLCFRLGVVLLCFLIGYFPFIISLFSYLFQMKFTGAAVMFLVLIQLRFLVVTDVLPEPQPTGIFIFILMAVIIFVFSIAGHQVVVIQSPTLANTSRIFLEAVFIGVLTSQLWMVATGISLYANWQRGGPGKICATVTVSAAAVLGVIKLALPFLGPGPSIGALMGLAGAVGVSLSAAGGVTDKYTEETDPFCVVGRFGVTVGAAVGAFLSSCTHSGLPGLFMSLCAATISAADFLTVLLTFKIYSSLLGTH